MEWFIIFSIMLFVGTCLTIGSIFYGIHLNKQDKSISDKYYNKRKKREAIKKAKYKREKAIYSRRDTKL